METAAPPLAPILEHVPPVSLNGSIGLAGWWPVSLASVQASQDTFAYSSLDRLGVHSEFFANTFIPRGCMYIHTYISIYIYKTYVCMYVPR